VIRSLVGCLLFAFMAPAALTADVVALRQALAAPVAATRAIAPSLGVHVVDVGSGESVYDLDADSPRILASNTKLFTSAAALDLLGPDYLFETSVLVRGPVVNGELRGDLAVVGGGDPNLSGRLFGGDPLALFRSWARALKASGVERIRGDIYLAHGIFDDQLVHPDWPRDQLEEWYEAPVAGLSFNDNCVLVRVQPAPVEGAVVQVQVIPELPLFAVDNQARTTNVRRQHRVRIDRGGSGLAIRGSVYRRSGGVEAWVAVADPVAYFGAALRQALSEEGIEVGGRSVPLAQLPNGWWRPLTVFRSDLLSTLEIVNKRSQNFYAESVLKLLGATLCGEGSWESGAGVVRDWLTAIGFDPDSFELADGSGMSRHNRFSARQVTRLLHHMFSHRLAREYLSTLAVSGERGLKWEKRLAEPPYRDNIFVKTGTLTGVSTLSGYVKARSGRIYAFSILGNRTRANWRMPDAQDEILRVLVDHG